MQENLLMMLSGLAKMEQEQIWTICVKLLNLQLDVVLKLLIFQIQLVILVPSEFTKIITDTFK